MSNKKGILIVVSGFSGAGKGTLMKKLLEEYDNYALSISATTRGPRQGEVDGREYFFKTTDEFEEMIRRAKVILDSDSCSCGCEGECKCDDDCDCKKK